MKAISSISFVVALFVSSTMEAGRIGSRSTVDAFAIRFDVNIPRDGEAKGKYMVRVGV